MERCSLCWTSAIGRRTWSPLRGAQPKPALLCWPCRMPCQMLGARGLTISRQLHLCVSQPLGSGCFPFRPTACVTQPSFAQRVVQPSSDMLPCMCNWSAPQQVTAVSPPMTTAPTVAHLHVFACAGLCIVQPQVPVSPPTWPTWCACCPWALSTHTT